MEHPEDGHNHLLWTTMPVRGPAGKTMQEHLAQVHWKRPVQPWAMWVLHWGTQPLGWPDYRRMVD